jgi:hypothetical protein
MGNDRMRQTEPGVLDGCRIDSGRNALPGLIEGLRQSFDDIRFERRCGQQLPRFHAMPYAPPRYYGTGRGWLNGNVPYRSHKRGSCGRTPLPQPLDFLGQWGTNSSRLSLSDKLLGTFKRALRGGLLAFPSPWRGTRLAGSGAPDLFRRAKGARAPAQLPACGQRSLLRKGPSGIVRHARSRSVLDEVERATVIVQGGKHDAEFALARVDGHGCPNKQFLLLAIDFVG